MSFPFPLWFPFFEESIHYLHVVCHYNLHVVYSTELEEFLSAVCCCHPSEFTKGVSILVRGLHPPKPMMHIAYFPYFHKIDKFPPYFCKIYTFSPYFLSIYVFSLNLHLFASPLFWSRTWHLWPLSLASAQQCWDWFELKSLRCVMVDIRLCAGNWIQLAWILLLRATYCCTDLEGSVYIHSSKL